MVWLKTLVFFLVVPGTVAGWVPYGLLRASGRATWPGLGPLQWLALMLGAAGVALVLPAMVEFARRGHGTPAPIDPPVHLVVEGHYRWTRNPMYIGVVSVLVAEGIFFRAPAVLAYAVAVLTMFQLFVVLYEEPTLRRHFGPAYDAYCRRVPRWIGRPRS